MNNSTAYRRYRLIVCATVLLLLPALRLFAQGQPGPYDGAWAGTTSQSKAISFVILNNAVTSLSIAYHIIGNVCTVDGTTTTTGQIPLAGNTFSVIIPTQGSVTGSISPTLQATGNFTVIFNGPPPFNCFGTAQGTWNASLTVPSPVPALDSISPSSATAGGAGFTLTANGSNFVNGSIVRWNGSDRTTTFVSDSQLTASIRAADISRAGTAQVTVFNPAPGGGASTPLTFIVNNPVPAMTLLAPSAAAPGGPAFTLTVYGNNFTSGSSGSLVNWNGSARTTRFASPTQLTAAIGAGDIATSGTAQVTVSTPGVGTSSALPFTINSASSIPSIPANGTVNAAGFQAGLAVAPGGIAAIFGSNLATQIAGASAVPLPTTLPPGAGGSSLLFNGSVPVPLFFVSSGQVNVQVPWELLGKTQASLTDTANGITGSPTAMTLAPFSPGIFTTRSSGSGQGEILIAGTATVAAPSGSLQGRDAQPVKRGAFIAIFCTGLGDVSNRPASGAPAPSQPPLALTRRTPTVTIGGVPANTNDPSFFSGLAPFFVGLYQVNLPVPSNAPTGKAVEVVLAIGGISSNKATIAVQ